MNIDKLIEMNRFFQSSSTHISLPGFIILCLIHENKQMSWTDLEKKLPGYDMAKQIKPLLYPPKLNSVGFVSEKSGKLFQLSEYGLAYMDKVL